MRETVQASNLVMASISRSPNPAQYITLNPVMPQSLCPDHYLYSVEIPDLTEDNHIVSAFPVHPSVISRVERKLGLCVPDAVRSKGKEFRKWLGCTLMGTKKAAFDEEKAAAEFLGAFNASHVRITRTEHTY